VLPADNDIFDVPDLEPIDPSGGIIYLSHGEEDLAVHGWLMWAAWSFFGLLQVVSLRYCRPLPKLLCIKNVNMALHILGGLVILIVTISMSIKVFHYYEWAFRWHQSLHSAIGLVVLFSVSLVTLLGFLVWLPPQLTQS
jgi:hypothetical protein